ncbi:MAG: hypothetical protein MMC33_002799 [Icmadophila ericetorum]|nr:hypothetical protein [Icmadophila ericetorum]
MSSSHTDLPDANEDEDLILGEDEAAEEIPDDEDAPMDSGDDGEEEEEEEEIQLQNDSLAHFDAHTDSVFCITSHPLDASLIATGSGDDTAYVFSTAHITSPVLPASYESNPAVGQARDSIKPIQKLEGHTDSVNAITWTLPKGEYLCTAGLDGNLRVYTTPSPATSAAYKFLAGAKGEVPEINFLTPCPHPAYPNTLALGASDGSVWIYTIDPTSDPSAPLQVQHAYFMHTGSVTAGAWTPDGKLLATVSEDGSLYVWDPFGEAAAQGIKSEGQSIFRLTAADQRFEVEGGLYSIAISHTGSFLATGGGGGMIKIVGLPTLGAGAGAAPTQNKRAVKGKGGSSAAGGAGGRGRGGEGGGGGGGSQMGQILASLQAQTDGIETLSFSSPPLTLLAAGSVDGSIALFDTAHSFAVRRHIRNAHDEFAVVKVEFLSPSPSTSSNPEGWLLTSAGMDGIVRRWDTRGGTAAAGMGLEKELKGHRGEGEGGGVLGFAQGGGKIITAGDDGLSLVFGA